MKWKYSSKTKENTKILTIKEKNNLYVLKWIVRYQFAFIFGWIHFKTVFYVSLEISSIYQHTRNNIVYNCKLTMKNCRCQLKKYKGKKCVVW